ncbi:MAG: phage tail tape measure protein [Thermoguttaceae bacterium]
MADTITTSLSLDASDVLSAYDKIAEGADRVADRINNLSSAMGKMSSVSSAVQNFGSSATSSFNQASSAAQQFTMSWQNVERIVESRLISQGIYAAKEAIESSISSAVKLGMELQRISNMTGVDSQVLGQQVRFLADASAVSLESAAAAMSAAYKANLGGMAETHQLLDEAANLAKATGSEPAGATSAIGGILKGFGMGVGDARKVSDELLTVTQKSRASVDELGGAFGRVAPLASRMGVSFEEVAASVITLVNGGMSVSQALGTVERTMKSLATPSASLTATMQSMGANSATSLIAAKGWGGALEALASTTSGTSEELMKLVKGARGISAEFTIGTGRAEDYKKALEDIQNTKMGAAADAAAATMDSAAGRMEAAGIRIKNTLIGMGDKALSVMNPGNIASSPVWGNMAEGLAGAAVAAVPLFVGKFYSGAGYAKELAARQAAAVAANEAAMTQINKISQGGPGTFAGKLSAQRTAADQAASEALRAEGSASEAYLAAAQKRDRTYDITERFYQKQVQNAEGLTAEAQAAAQAARNYEMLGIALKGVGVSIMALGAGWIIGSGFNDQMAKIKTTIDESEARWLEQKRAVDQRQIDSDADVINKRIASALNASTELSTTYNSQLVAAQEEGQEEIRANDEKLRQMLASHKGYLSEIISAEKEAQGEIMSGMQRIAALHDKAQEQQFKNQLDRKAFDPTGQIHMLEAQGASMIREAEKLMEDAAKTGDKAEMARGRSIFAQVEQLDKQAEAIARSEVAARSKGETPAQIKYNESYDREVQSTQGFSAATIQAQIRAEERVMAIEKQRVQNLGAEHDRQQSITDEIEKQVAIVIKNSAILDKQGNPLPKAELDRMAGLRQAAEARLEELKFNQGDAQQARRLGLAKQLTGQMEKEPANLQISVERSLAAIPARIDRVFAEYKAHLNVDIGGLEAALGRPIKNQQDLVEGFKAVGAEIRGIETKAFGMKGMQDQIDALRAGIQTTKEVGEQGWAGTFRTQTIPGTAFSDVAIKIEDVKQKFLDISKSSNVTMGDLYGIKTEVEGISAAAGPFDAGVRLWVQDFATMLEKLIQIRDIQQRMIGERRSGAGDERVLDMRSNYFNDVLNRSPGGQAPSTQYNGVTQGINNVGTAAETASQKLERMNALIQQEGNAQAVTPQTAVQNNTPLPSDIINGNPHRFGGYLASGGTPRGVDTIPIWASKGEFIVNADSARKFSSQLMAMNAGVAPSSHTHAGSVTNVGDISVHLHSGGAVGVGTGRQIANELRRELRRGSSSL